MSELIRKQDALDSLGERPPVWTGSDYELGQRNQYDLDKLHLELVPSAQPERPEQPESAKEYCAECDHIEMCRWYPWEGCEFRSLPSAQPETNCSEFPNNSDTISRQAAIDALDKRFDSIPMEQTTEILLLRKDLRDLPSAQPDSNKYEYHYDHTDCIWFRPEARNRCPSTCAQYRDGWNDAMNYIFRDGKGYRPYRRDANYGE